MDGISDQKECPTCQNQFQNLDALNDHIKQIHTTSGKTAKPSISEANSDLLDDQPSTSSGLRNKEVSAKSENESLEKEQEAVLFPEL